VTTGLKHCAMAAKKRPVSNRRSGIRVDSMVYLRRLVSAGLGKRLFFHPPRDRNKSWRCSVSSGVEASRNVRAPPQIAGRRRSVAADAFVRRGRAPRRLERGALSGSMRRRSARQSSGSRAKGLKSGSTNAYSTRPSVRTTKVAGTGKQASRSAVQFVQIDPEFAIGRNQRRSDVERQAKF